jgi:hypothetical protein
LLFPGAVIQLDFITSAGAIRRRGLPPLDQQLFIRFTFLMRRFLLGTETERQSLGESCGVLLAQFE